MHFGRVLIAINHDDLAVSVADVGIELAVRLGAEAALVHAVDPSVGNAAKGVCDPAYLVVQAVVAGRSLIEQVAKRAKLQSPPFEFVPVGYPAAEIVKTADDWMAEIIVLGSSPRRNGMKRELQDHVAEEVMRHAPCPILVVRTNR